MNLKSANYIFAAFILVIGCCLSVLSQNKCNLQIGVYEFKDDGSSEEFPVKDAKITLVSTKTGKPFKISQNTDNSTFTDIDEGEYKISVEKEGFKKNLSVLPTDCSITDAQNTVTNIVFLWKGNPKETMTFGESGQPVAGYDVAKGGEPINKGAVLLVKPEYPAAARAVGATGAVNVQVTINELGYVISAQAVSGHPLLRSAAVKAAKGSKFRMTFLEGIPVKVTGIIVYNFVP